MVLKRVFIVGSLSFIFALQGWGQASGKHDTILANYELVQEFQEFTLGGKLSNNSLSIYPREMIQIISGLIFKRQLVKITIM